MRKQQCVETCGNCTWRDWLSFLTLFGTSTPMRVVENRISVSSGDDLEESGSRTNMIMHMITTTFNRDVYMERAPMDRYLCYRCNSCV